MVMKAVEVMRRTKSQKVRKEVRVKAKEEVMVLLQAKKALMEKNANSSENKIHDTYSILAHFSNLKN